jgi:hypothetical protein
MGRLTVDQSRNGPFYLEKGGKMNHKLEAKIRKEIRRRALERAHLLRQEKQNLQKIEYTLDALQEVTELPRPDLQSIAEEVRLSRQMTRDNFFSVRNQILMTLGVSSLILLLCWFI